MLNVCYIWLFTAEYYHDNPPDNTRGAIVTQPTAQSTVIVQPTVPGGSVYPRQQQQAPPWPQPAPQWNPQVQPQGYQGKSAQGFHPQILQLIVTIPSFPSILFPRLRI